MTSRKFVNAYKRENVKIVNLKFNFNLAIGNNKTCSGPVSLNFDLSTLIVFFGCSALSRFVCSNFCHHFRYWLFGNGGWRHDKPLYGQMTPTHFWHWDWVLDVFQTRRRQRSNRTIEREKGKGEGVVSCIVCALWREAWSRERPPWGLTRFGSIVHTQPEAALSRIRRQSSVTGS